MGKPSLTQEYLQECLHYAPETGVFTWLRRPRAHFKTNAAWKAWGSSKVGAECGHVESQKGYRFIVIGDIAYAAHRLAFIYMMRDAPPQVDHINHVRSDNSWANLRRATPEDNQKNKSRQSNNTSGVMGVTYDKSRQKWKASISVGRKPINLGRFGSLEEAAKARLLAERRYGFHKNHGDLACPT